MLHDVQFVWDSIQDSECCSPSSILMPCLVQRIDGMMSAEV